MGSAMYVVFVTTLGEQSSFKVFDQRADAIVFAEQQIGAGASQADIFESPKVADARAAKAAVEMGEGKLIDARGRKASETELARYDLNLL